MRLKSYFAGTVESAIRLARQEMGEEAMIVNSRKAPPETRHLGAYEVVFAADADSRVETASAVRQPAARPVKVDEPEPPSALMQEVAEMRRQLAKVSAQVSRTAARGRRRGPGPVNPALDEL